MGAETKLKAGAAGNQKGKPPSVTTAAGLTSAAGDKPTSGRVVRPLLQCRAGSAPGMQGAPAPCIKITFNPPLPAGKGVGGMGAETKLKAGAAGNKAGKPPAGCRQRPPNRQRWGQAPPRAPQRQGEPTPPGTSPPPGAWFAPCSSAARVQPRGCKGRSPLHKNNL